VFRGMLSYAMVRRGMVWQGSQGWASPVLVSHVEACRGLVWQGSQAVAWRDRAGCGPSGNVESRFGKAVAARQGEARRGKDWCGEFRQGKAA
jgi:hypothetical protein